MNRLELAKKKHNTTKERLSKEKNAQDNLERANKGAEVEHQESESMLNEVEKEIRL